MIFSSKIYKIENGNNVSMYAPNKNELLLYLHNKSLNLYSISTNNKLNCTFLNKTNHHKIIQLNKNHSCICYGDDMRVVKNEEIIE